MKKVTVHVLATKPTQTELISNSPVVYGQDIEIIANVTFNGEKVTVGKVKYFINNVENETLNVTETLKFKADSMEGYVVSAIYLDNGEYTSSQAEDINIVVNKADNNIKVEIETASYPDEITVKVTADIAGTYTVDINGSKVDVKVDANGATGTNTTILTPGSYYANITDYESDYYNAICTNNEFSVGVKDNTITVTVDEGVKYGQSATVRVTADIAGNYTVDINGSPLLWKSKPMVEKARIPLKP